MRVEEIKFIHPISLTELKILGVGLVSAVVGDLQQLLRVHARQVALQRAGAVSIGLALCIVERLTGRQAVDDVADGDG